jgi:hypothetical protein
MKIMHSLEFRKSEIICLYTGVERDEELATDWKIVKECDHGIISRHYSG